MTEQTDRVLSSIDATLEGWHGRDGTVSGDAMRWAPHPPESLPTADLACTNCERCTWNPGGDCGRIEHEHCPSCSHCLLRHDPNCADPDALPKPCCQYDRWHEVTLQAGRWSCFDCSRDLGVADALTL